MSVKAFFEDNENLALIDRLRKAGLQMQVIEDKTITKTNKLNAQTFVVSGTFASFSRDELKSIIENNGGKNVSGVSAKTNYLVAGEKTGPSKLASAEKLGVKIISEQEFIGLIE